MSTSGENLADLIKYCGVSTGELADAEKREFDEGKLSYLYTSYTEICSYVADLFDECHDVWI